MLNQEDVHAVFSGIYRISSTFVRSSEEEAEAEEI